jgi:hypothetical protein
LSNALDLLNRVTQTLTAKLKEDPDTTLANATIYLDMFGRIFAAWMWLQQASKAIVGLAEQPADNDRLFYRGKLQTARYYFEWELPEIEHQAKLLSGFNTVTLEMQPEWF